MTIQWIIDKMEAWAPSKWALESDNVGLMIGDRSSPISRVLVALDLTEDVLKEAVQGRFDFVITHHPMFSRHIPPINRITTDNVLGKKIITLISNGIGLFCAHTNLDMAPGGVNDLLFDCIGLTEKEPLIAAENPEYPSMGLVGMLNEPMPLSSLAEHVSKVLSSKQIRYTGMSDQIVHRVGLCGGNGTNQKLIDAAFTKKCDVYITGDCHYHMALQTMEAGLSLIDGSHYATEIIIINAVANYIRNMAEKDDINLIVQCSQVDGQVFKST
ncbi:MAG: Nif3-like dinuclear metal center hexameric protein [Defluviitaleaceae bacterium]|nr:Nif3-like dinuclear metal center hexameric protein [Defluviitaleaceae bacterium]